MAEATKALTGGIFNEDEYLEQSGEVLRERIRLFDYELDRYGDTVTLIVMSDHGFEPCRYCFNPNRWLEEEGYLSVIDPQKREEKYLKNIDWSKTRAYALGFNSLYINLQRREAQGIVPPSQKMELMRKIAGKLESLKSVGCKDTDPRVVQRAYIADEVYSGPYKEYAPDIIIGYNSGYSVSWQSALGMVSGKVLEPNGSKWSGDHCIDREVVPGILLCNKPIKKNNPGLCDIAPTVLKEYNIPTPGDMVGNPIFKCYPKLFEGKCLTTENTET